MSNPNQKNQNQNQNVIKSVPVPVFGPVEDIRGQDRLTVIEGRRGSKSIPCISAVVPLPSCGLKIEATIWGRLEMAKDGSRTVTFEAGLPKGMSALDVHSEGAERFKQHVELAVAAWPGYDRVTDRAFALLTGEKPVSVVERPRLVKTAKVEAETKPAVTA